MSREKWRAASQNSGATTSDTSASSQRRYSSTPVNTTIRRLNVIASITAPSTRFSIEAMSPVRRASTSPSRRRSKTSSDSPCRCANSFVRRSSRKCSPTHVEKYSSANPSNPSSRFSPR